MRKGGRSRGFTLMETSVVLGIVSILTLAGLSQVDLRPASLLVVQEELPAALEHAFELAKARGTDVAVSLGHLDGNAPDVVPFALPSTVRWGKPAEVPMPKGMAEAPVATAKGEAHAQIIVTPHHTTAASAWFFHNVRKDTVCMRLSGRGHIVVLSWTAATRTWTRVH